MKNNKKRTLAMPHFPSYSVYQFINNTILHILHKKLYKTPHVYGRKIVFHTKVYKILNLNIKYVFHMHLSNEIR